MQYLYVLLYTVVLLKRLAGGGGLRGGESVNVYFREQYSFFHHEARTKYLASPKTNAKQPSYTWYTIGSRGYVAGAKAAVLV